MITIETTIIVLPDGSISIPPHPELAPGAHRAVLVVEGANPTRQTWPPPKLKMLDTSGWPDTSTYRREDLYDDDGR